MYPRCKSPEGHFCLHFTISPQHTDLLVLEILKDKNLKKKGKFNLWKGCITSGPAKGLVQTLF